MYSFSAALLSVCLLMTSNQALQLLRDGDWEGATSAYQQVILANPYRAENFLNLGYSYMQQDKCEQAQEAFDRALFLGGVRHSALYYSARCAAIKGDEEAAIDWLELAAQSGFDRFDRVIADDSFRSLVNDPRIQRLTMTQDLSSLDRNAGWREDIAYLDQVIRQRHVSPFHTINEAEWATAINNLVTSIDQLNEYEIRIELMRTVAMIGDGHTVVYPPFEGPAAFSLVPVRPYLFADGVYIRAAHPNQARLLGAKLEAIGEVPIDKAMAKLSAALPSDNKMTLRWLLELALRIPELHAAAGFGEDSKSTIWKLRLANGKTESVHLNGQPPQGDPLSRSIPENWLDAAPSEDQPLWLRRPETYYHYERLDDPRALYFRYNQIRESGTESLANFLDRMFNELDSFTGHALVIDLRRNNGGNSTLNPQLMHRLVSHPIARQNNMLYVITGRRTFSAAQNLASDLDRETQALFVGEPTGSRPNFYGEDHIFRLPFSGLTGSVSTRYWQGGRFSDDDRRWIAPDLVAELTFEDYRSNRDPALNTIRDHMAGPD